MEQEEIIIDSLPESVEKSATREALQKVMDKSVHTIIKKHRNSIDKIKKDEFQAFIAADSDNEGDVVREFRKNLIKSEIERVLKSRKNNEFIPPGIINKCKKQIEENLNFMLPSMAHYQGLIRDQMSPEHSDLEPLDQPNLEPTTQKKTKDDAEDGTADVLPSAYQTGCAAGATGDGDVQNSLSQLLHEKPHKRLAAIKALSKKQIALLIEDCQKALEQKHQEDIRDLAHQIQAQGISIEELEAALSR